MATAALGVLDAVTNSCALDGLLEVEIDEHRGERDALLPSLVVRLAQLKRRDDGFLDRVRRALDALAALVRASQSLDVNPAAKHAFWWRVLTHPACRSLFAKLPYPTKLHLLRFDDADFPRLVLDYSRSEFTVELARTIAEWECSDGTASGWLGVGEISTPWALGQHVEPVALRLQHCQLIADSIQSLEVVLNPCLSSAAAKSMPTDKVEPRFRVAALDLTDNSLGAEQMDALAHVIRAASQPLDTLVLRNVKPWSDALRVQVAFRTLIRAAAGLTAGCSGGVRFLSLAHNPLNTEQLAAICSAVQDPASSIEELSLASTIRSTDSRFYSWWWLAMGLSQRIDRHGADGNTSRLRRVDLSWNPLYPRDIEVWRSTLQSPLAVLTRELIHPLPSSVYELPAHGCRVFSSPGVDVESVEPIAEVADMFSSLPADAVVSLEALGSDDDGWVCVIIPGYGLVWVPPSSRPAVHQSAIQGSAVSEQRRSIVRTLHMDSMIATATTDDCLCAFIESVGGSLTALSIKSAATSNSHRLEAILASILLSCPRLELLDLENSGFLPWGPLIRALEGPLRQTLRSLNLRGCRFGYKSAGLLAAALVETTPLPVLEELRLGRSHIGIAGAHSIARVLRNNKHLRVLELPLNSLEAAAKEYAELRDSLRRSFHCEPLGAPYAAPMPTRCKLAFISALRARKDLAALSTEVLRVIFELAALGRLRHLLWY